MANCNSSAPIIFKEVVQYTSIIQTFCVWISEIDRISEVIHKTSLFPFSLALAVGIRQDISRAGSHIFMSHT